MIFFFFFWYKKQFSQRSANSLNAQQIWKNLNSWKALNALLTTHRHEVNFCLTITYSLLLKGGHFDSKFDGWRHSLSSDQYSFSLSQRSTNLKKNKWKTHFRAWNTSDLKKKSSGHETLRNTSQHLNVWSLLQHPQHLNVWSLLPHPATFQKFSWKMTSFLGKRGHQEYKEAFAMPGKVLFGCSCVLIISCLLPCYLNKRLINPYLLHP